MSRATLGISLLCALALTFVGVSRAAAQPACDPSTMCCAAFDSGSTCGGAGVATLGNTSGLDLGVGNPINVLNGNKFQREVDMPALPGVLGLEVVRYYNSADTRNGLLGRGWRLSYETELRVRPRGLEVVQADGARIFFGPASAQDGAHRARDPMQGLVRALPGARGTEYLWLWADGRELRFSARGRLEQIRVPSGEFVSLRYDERGWLRTVIDPAGRRLDLQYLDKAAALSGERYRGVQSIDTPVGRYRYEHGGVLPAGSKAPPSEVIANLTRVLYPATEGGAGGEASSRQYHYEDARFPTLLTGISALGGEGSAGLRSERLNTWAYDEQRRAVLSTLGEGGAGNHVALQWRPGQNRQGEAVLSEGQGRGTVYSTALVAGERRLLRVRGPGCPDCAESDRRYGYDALGRLVEETRFDELGRPLLTRRTERDPHGRPHRLIDIPYRDGRAMPPQWRARYEYAALDAKDPLALPDPRPVLIATPSVLPGRERRIHLRYNAARQLVSITEEGFSPVDAQGRAVPTGVSLQRVTRYGYQHINGRSVRVSTDGPLPNGASGGPADSDVTRFEWDARGERLLRLTRPGALVTRLVHEAATARLIGFTDPAGVVSGLSEYVPQLGRPRAVRHGGQPTRLQFDLRGRVSRVQVGEASVALAPGDPAIAEPALEAGRPRHDAWGRPVAWYAAPSADDAVLQAAWGPIGSAAERTVLAWTAAPAQAVRQLDDFGRVVAVRQPGQGWAYAAHDAADRIVATTDPRGARQLVSRDSAGRVLRIEHRPPGESRAQQVVQRRYEGERLIEESLGDADGTRRTRYAYGANGALLSEALDIEPAGELGTVLARPVKLTLSYRYAAGGQLSARLITDASGRTLSVDQALNAQGLVERIGTGGVLPRWLGGGRDIVRSVDWQAWGMLQYATHIAHGDGSVDAFERLFEAVPGAAVPPAGAAVTRHRTAPAAARPPLPQRRAAPGWGHDAAGLPAFLPTRLGLQGLRWNAAGQLAQTQREAGRSRYLYDARGRRVAILVVDARGAPSLRLALYEDHRLMAEADAQGRLSHAYVHLGQRPVAQLVLPGGWGWAAFKAWLFGPSVRHLHTARAGRVLSASEDGARVWRDGEQPVEPEPGAASGAQPAAVPAAVRVHQPLRYVGQYHDTESGLDYHGARFFEPGVGRFISPDPSGVADAIDGLAPSYLLDAYAYAGGQPDEFFDPDGAARIRYFAITTNAQGKPMGSTQGFVKARWAFIVDKVAAGGDSSTAGQLRDRYASEGRSVLVDVEGSFLGKGKSSVDWGGPEATMAQEFLKYYGDKLISIPQFTIDDMDDDDAAQLIASYIEADKQKLSGAGCPVRAALLPPIRFADEELPIDVTKAQYTNPSNDKQVWASSQRIVQCGEKAKTDIVERRIQKYNFGFMLLESNPPQIYMDCSKDGCPGKSLRGTVLSDYVASYGQTQFIGTTMVEKLRMLRAGTFATAAERAALRLDDKVLWEAVVKAEKRAEYAGTQSKAWKPDKPEWAGASKETRDAFTSGTGLDESAAEALWNDIRSWYVQPSPNLAGEAQAAIGTTVLMNDPKVRDYLMEIFRDSRPGGKFSTVSLALVRDNYAQIRGRVEAENAEKYRLADGAINPLWEQRQRQIELELAARTARMHNGDLGNFAAAGSLSDMWRRDSSAKGRQYARRFLNTPEYPVRQPSDARRQQPVGDYFALRCATGLPPTIGKLGMQVTPIKTP